LQLPLSLHPPLDRTTALPLTLTSALPVSTLEWWAHVSVYQSMPLVNAIPDEWYRLIAPELLLSVMHPPSPSPSSSSLSLLLAVWLRQQ
jgi:hypothetical protein